MSIGENHSLSGELVDVRGFDLTVFRIETLHISIAQVVTHDEDDIGAALTEAYRMQGSQVAGNQTGSMSRFSWVSMLGDETNLQLLDHGLR